ncbi:MAG: hypothetical protein ROW52_03110 [Anaerolineaceae bacterium]|jgi:hypothetical protein
MPPLRNFVLAGLILAITGWGGLYGLVFYMLPTLAPRWLAFFCLTLALAGTAMPIVAFLNHRFPSKVPADGGVILRQTLWVSIYGILMVWLQLGRVLNSALAGFLAIGFILIEFTLRLRETSRWEPHEPRDE